MSGSPRRLSSVDDLRSVHIDLGDTPLAKGTVVGDMRDPLLEPNGDEPRGLDISALVDDADVGSDEDDDFVVDIRKGLFREDRFFMSAVVMGGAALGVYLWSR